ncbi:MAG: hypothetical protein LRY41_03480 [Candidatus Pacebacteria bacterium]|nr:hypothetical protein [Candidatus Paceibacterota bacterium]MCD8508289.1 hypothetical protein [Candidatus Paceibacterota bacterium]MCD8528352.1 hypothetical protein [Candidatus Paceibacterota bacterium]MCD8563989.1 hypothetical protein [Candidatus Paceibacterota bacterium]
MIKFTVMHDHEDQAHRHALVHLGTLWEHNKPGTDMTSAFGSFLKSVAMQYPSELELCIDVYQKVAKLYYIIKESSASTNQQDVYPWDHEIKKNLWTLTLGDTVAIFFERNSKQYHTVFNFINMISLHKRHLKSKEKARQKEAARAMIDQLRAYGGGDLAQGIRLWKKNGTSILSTETLDLARKILEKNPSASRKENISFSKEDNISFFNH